MYNAMSGFEKYICMGVQVDGRLKINQYQMKSWSKSATENQLYCILMFSLNSIELLKADLSVLY